MMFYVCLRASSLSDDYAQHWQIFAVSNNLRYMEKKEKNCTTREYLRLILFCALRFIDSDDFLIYRPSERYFLVITRYLTAGFRFRCVGEYLTKLNFLFSRPEIFLRIVLTLKRNLF